MAGGPGQDVAVTSSCLRHGLRAVLEKGMGFNPRHVPRAAPTHTHPLRRALLRRIVHRQTRRGLRGCRAVASGFGRPPAKVSSCEAVRRAKQVCVGPLPRPRAACCEASPDRLVRRHCLESLANPLTAPKCSAALAQYGPVGRAPLSISWNHRPRRRGSEARSGLS